MNTQRYAELFRAEARERLTEMNNALLAIERGEGVERVSELFRAVHNVKGMSAAMGYQSIRDLSHALETLLEKLRHDEGGPSTTIIESLFDAVDSLERAIVLVSTDPTASPDVSKTVSMIEDLAEAADAAVELPVLPTMEWPTMRAPATPSAPLSRAPAGQVGPTRTAPYGVPLIEGKRSVRVDAERLDSLMNLIGELVIARERLTELARKTRDQELVETVSHASRLIGSLQDEITRSRMVPVGQAFERFERLVRDTSHELGKSVVFDLAGTDIEVDKSVLDEIGDPVMHLLRNALDHGIETPVERRKAGKGPMARLGLSAERERAEVVIHVTDDGRGIDRNKVLGNARSSGLVSPAATELTDAQLLELIARPGFSTTASVTRLSGRGVGLDVVATKVRTLGGTMELSTATGKGTTITIRLPMTLAIIQALLARTAGDVYALPITHVVETMVLSPEMSSYEDGREMLSIRGEKVPVVRLRARLGHPLRAGGAGHVVVLDLPERRVGLVVDEFIGRQEVVVKPFDAVRGMPQMFSGATILSNGAPALILDPRAVA